MSAEWLLHIFNLDFELSLTSIESIVHQLKSFMSLSQYLDLTLDQDMPLNLNMMPLLT